MIHYSKITYLFIGTTWPECTSKKYHSFTKVGNKWSFKEGKSKISGDLTFMLPIQTLSELWFSNSIIAHLHTFNVQGRSRMSPISSDEDRSYKIFFDTPKVWTKGPNSSYKKFLEYVSEGRSRINSCLREISNGNNNDFDAFCRNRTSKNKVTIAHYYYII